MTNSPLPAAATAQVATRSIKPPAPAKATAYKVQRGETLTSISRKFRCDLADLARTNRLKAPKFAIRPGQALKLEGCKG